MFSRKQKVFLILGLALLLGFAYTGTVSKSPALSWGLSPSQSAAAALWRSTNTAYDGWPAPHLLPMVAPQKQPSGWYAGWPLTSYFDAYVTDNPSQAVVAKVVLPGGWTSVWNGAYWTFTWRPHQAPTYSGSIPAVPPGTPITLDWACQDYQVFVAQASGYCTSYDAFNNCISYGGGGTFLQRYNDYGPAVGTNFTAGTNIGSKVVAPVQTTTYSLYCPASGWNFCSLGCTATIVMPSTPVMSITVNVSDAPPPPPPPPPPAPQLSLTPAASTVPYNGTQTLTYSATGGGGYDACYLAGGQWGSAPGTPVGTSGAATTNPLTSNTIYSYTCHSSYYGWVAPVNATVAVGAAPPLVVSLSVNPATVSYNTASSLSWSVQNASSCRMTGGQYNNTSVDPNGGPISTGNLTQNTGFTLTCQSPYGYAPVSDSKTVTVGTQAPTVSLSPASQTILSGQNANLTYTLGGGAPTSVTYRVNGGAAVPASGGGFSVSGLGVGVHTIVMTVSNAGGSNTSNTASVTVNAPCPAHCPGPAAPNCIADSGYTYNPGSNTCTPNDICTDIPGNQLSVPVGCVMPNPAPGACIPGGYFYDAALNQCVAPGLALTAAPLRVQKGNSTTLTWSAQNITAGSCSLKNSSGATLSTSPSGSMQVAVQSQTVYTLSCGSPVGIKTKSVTVGLIPNFKEI